MKLNHGTTLAPTLLALITQISAQVASVCPSTNVCFKLNIPENTASSGSGDVFFQLSAPSNYEWVALGQGDQMGGSNMFVVYTSKDGNNVTLSPRTASGHNMPTSNNAAQVTLLEGSGVSNNVMTANVRCSNCDSWSGGTMDFKSSKGDWIYAFNPSNGPKNSDDKSVSIRQHTGHDAFSWDFANAKGGSSVNPLVAAAPAPAASGTGSGSGPAATSCRQRNAASSATGSGTAGAASPSQSSSSDDNNENDDNGGQRSRYESMYGSFPTARPTARPPTKRADLPYCDELPGNSGSNGGSSPGITPIGASRSGVNQQAMLIAHGVLASLAFVILFPAGAIAVRLASFPGIAWLHGAFQIFAYLIYIAAAGLGIYMARGLRLLNNRHPIIGLVVLAVLFFQPILGLLHHRLFKKYSHRTLWSYSHIWLGRAAVTLGIINGGLGLQLAGNSRSGEIAYGVIAGFMWLVWVAAIVVGERRRKTALKNAPHKQRLGSDGSEARAVPADHTRGHYEPKQT